MKPLTWKLFNELFFWELASLLFTHVTISFSTMGLPVLANCVNIESVYALINCQINAGKKEKKRKNCNTQFEIRSTGHKNTEVPKHQSLRINKFKTRHLSPKIKIISFKNFILLITNNSEVWSVIYTWSRTLIVRSDPATQN